MRPTVLAGLMALAVATAALGSGCTLIVKKNVINDDGGSKSAADFSFSLNGGDAVAFEPDGENELTVGAGPFNVTEVADSAYAATLEGCSGVIAAGETKTCTITNDDLPGTVIVRKTVIDDDGGTKTADDFSATVNGVTKPFANGQASFTIPAGGYEVTEPPADGYEASFGQECDGQVGNGETVTCTITNDDSPPPPPPPGVGYCVKTSSHGWTFLQATAGAFEPGQRWHQLYLEKATVIVAGKAVTFAGIEPWEPNGGIILAPRIEGIGLTCDQPYVRGG